MSDVFLIILGIAGALFVFYLQCLIIRAVFSKKNDR